MRTILIQDMLESIEHYEKCIEFLTHTALDIIDAFNQQF